jgi:predicted nuclease of predicted toxin-antitoxin system
MRFYLDENVPLDVVRVGRALGLDVVSSHEVGNDALSDREQLDYAAAQVRCLITINRDDFIRLTDEFSAVERPHKGVLIISHRLAQQSPRRIVDAIVAYVKGRGSAPADYLCDFLRP